MFSIVVICNNKQIFDNWLFKSLLRQNVRYELIIIDNSDNKYNSAAKALNEGCRKAVGDYIMCVHQDVEFYGMDFLKKAEDLLNSLRNIGIAGVAGMSETELTHKDRRRNIIHHGYPDKHSWGNEIKTPEEVQTLDECLLIIPSKVVRKVSFDETTCYDWHLYGVDYCLSIKEAGLRVYVLPLQIYHRSKGDSATPEKSFLRVGSKTPEYYRSLRKVLKKHRNAFEKVTTTCGDWSTTCPILLQRSFHYLKFKLQKYEHNF